MANPYHDEQGRFCSRDEMRAAIDKLAANGQTLEAMKLNAEYNTIVTEQEKKKGLAGLFKNILHKEEKIEGIGSDAEWDKIATGRNTSGEYLNRAFTYNKMAEDPKHMAAMFIVKAEEYKYAAQQKEALGKDVKAEKAIYRAMMKETELYVQNFGSGGATNNDVETYLDSRLENAKANPRVLKANQIALEQMLEHVASSYDDENWNTYPDTAKQILGVKEPEQKTPRTREEADAEIARRRKLRDELDEKLQQAYDQRMARDTEGHKQTVIRIMELKAELGINEPITPVKKPRS